MKLREIYKNTGNVKISFEVFPPKDEEKTQNLFDELEILKKFNPSFVSLTWGAGGNENKSTELVKEIKNIGLDVTPHFTCVCSTKEFVKSHIEKLKDLNIDKILALRGDIPEDKSLCSKDFRYANELVEFLKSKSELSVGVAGYPEGHIETETIEEDIKNLKKKVDAGADAIFTQLFFYNDKFFRYCELVEKQGINIPVIPGIMPILSKKQIDKMTALARITIPNRLLNMIEKYQDNNSDMQKMGIEYVSEQCEKLIQSEVSGLHFFTLNKSKSTKIILENIL
ncbi:methylenetetrahydrofolate reductase [bacterium]|nr:methylenetetrahydrofolate reductase [NAD(P)H] [bacterium]